MDIISSLQNYDFIEYSNLNSEIINYIQNNQIDFIKRFFLVASPEVLKLAITPENINLTYRLNGGKDEHCLLYFSIVENRTDLFDLLLESGADPNIILVNTRTPVENYRANHVTILVFACQVKNSYYIQKLLEFGANPNYVPPVSIVDIRNGEIFTSGFIEDGYHPRHPICEAAYKRKYSHIDYLMAYGADINFDNGDMLSTPLYGILKNLPETRLGEGVDLNILEELLNKGIILDKCIHPYLVLVIHNHPEDFAFAATKLLLQYCIDPNLNMYVYHDRTISPGTYAEFFDDKDLEWWERKATNITPLDSAFCFQESKKLQVLLLACGANLSECEYAFIYLSLSLKQKDLDMFHFLMDIKKNNYPGANKLKFNGKYSREFIHAPHPIVSISDNDSFDIQTKKKVIDILVENGSFLKFDSDKKRIADPEIVQYLENKGMFTEQDTRPEQYRY